MSDNYSFWEFRLTYGLIIGFVGFGLCYFIIIGMIFYDIKKRMREYDEVIEDDLAQM